MIRPPIKNEAEDINLGQKKRLRYLLTRYLPRHLSGVELYRRLRLSNAYDAHEGQQNSEKGFKEKIRADENRWLPDTLALQGVTVSQFKQWMQLKGEPNYRRNRGFDRKTCEALGFVIADEFEHWPRGRLDDAEHETAYRALAEFIKAGAGQPAEIFYGIRPAFAEELTDDKREQIASLEQCRHFLRGGIPYLNIVNANATIRRDVESIDGRSIVDFIKDDPRRMLLFTSAAGDGKTTLLYRLARTFFDRKWHVLIKPTNTGRETFDMPLGRSVDTLILIDRGEDLGDLDHLCSWLADNPRLHIILAARDLEWRNRNLRTEDGRFKYQFINRLSDGEIDGLAKMMQKFKATYDLTSLDGIKTRLRNSLRYSQYPHMLAAVMSATQRKNFSEILTSMVDRFYPKELLKLTALGATMQFNDGQPLYCTSNIMWAALASSEKLEVGRDRFDRIYRKVRSEIIPIGSNRYDLRHPDITQFVLRKFYIADDAGVFNDAESLESDILAFADAVFRLRMFESLSIAQRQLMTRYLDRIPEFWWDSVLNPDHDVGRKLFEGICNLFDTSEHEAGAKANLMLNWARLEAQKGAFGDLRGQPPFSARSIFRQGWENHDILGPSAAEWMRRWAALEATKGELGDLQGQPKFSARWIFQQAWEAHDTLCSVELMRRWGELEATRGELGDLHGEPKFSARWIFQRAWESRDTLCNVELMTRWADIESKHQKGIIGDKDKPEDFSARWIFRQAWEARDTLCSVELMTHWADVESEHQKGIIGNKDNPEDFSARWIFRQAWQRYNIVDIQFFDSWIRLEIRERNFGEDNDSPTKYTARWALCEAVKLGMEDEMSLGIEALIAVGENNLGEFDDPEPRSARALFRKLFRSGKMGHSRWFRRWAKMEYDAADRAPNVGKEFSVEWIFEKVKQHGGSQASAEFDREKWLTRYE